jgi:O-antigen/teichoic acid export membrane protein
MICLAFVIKGINFVFTLGFHQAKKTTVFAAIIISSMFLTLLLNIILIPILEIWGAAVSMIISYFTMMLLTYRSAQKLYYINYELLKIIKLIAAAVILFLIVFFTGQIPYYFHFVLKLLILMGFPFLLKFIGFYDEIELLRLKQSWAKWRNPKNWPANIKKIKF